MGLMLAVSAIVALLAGGWMWSQAPDYKVLFSNVSDRDGGAIIASLQQMNVPYKFAEGGGAILVPANQVHDARLKLAAQGLPKGGLVGFELMENQKFGTSQFLNRSISSVRWKASSPARSRRWQRSVARGSTWPSASNPCSCVNSKSRAPRSW